MKKIVLVLTLILFGVTINQSCKKSIDNSNDDIDNFEINKKQDKDLENLAKIVSVAINEDKDFRKTIKDEALIKFDGDYDILLKSFKNKTVNCISPSKTRTRLWLNKCNNFVNYG